MKLVLYICFYFLTVYAYSQALDLDLLDSLVESGHSIEAIDYLKSIKLEDFNNHDIKSYYRWLGEAYRETDKLEESVTALRKGIALCRYKEMSAESYHLHSELCKTLRVSFLIDDSLIEAKKAIDISLVLNDSSKIWRAHFLLGNVYYSKEELDSTLHYYQIANAYLPLSDNNYQSFFQRNQCSIQLDRESWEEAISCFNECLNRFSAQMSDKRKNNIKIQKSFCLIKLNQIEAASILLEESFKLASEKGWNEQLLRINQVKLEKIAKQNNLPEIVAIKDSISEIEHRLFALEDRTANEKYENEALNTQLDVQQSDLEKAEEESRKRRLWLMLLSGLFGLASVIAYFVYRNSRLKAALLLNQEQFEKQAALQAERNRIASEMHDDLGGGLTTIKFISQRAIKKIKNPEDQKLLEKISDQSATLVNNMSEIIWAMNSGFDNLDSLAGYIRRYAKSYLLDHEIKLNFETSNNFEQRAISGEKRRHIFLVIKEALHNVVKHADASQVDMNISFSEKLNIVIKDNGKGLGDQQNQFGNGMKNMQTRIKDIGGVLTIEDLEGIKLSINVPLDQAENKIATD